MQKNYFWLTLSLVLAVIVSQRGQAFPEMVRHGYANCMTCHISPDGGGVLTAYGRSLSREVLSTWGAEGEERFAYVVNPPEWLNLGGDVRGVQSIQRTIEPTRQVERARTVLMQVDVEAAAQIEKWTFDVSLGRQSEVSNNNTGSVILSRRHYVNYRPTDNLSFRAGRFQLPYGINLADHFVSIKRGLRWDDGSESYNVEAAYIGENQDLFITGTFGRPDNEKLNRDKGISIRGSTFLNERYKLGASYFYGSSPFGSRHVAGPYAILGFTHDWFVLAEVDFQALTPLSGAGRAGLTSYLKLDHEFFKGVHLYLTHEYGKLDWTKTTSENQSFGIGTQLFLRPHVEINASFQKMQIRGLSDEYGDFGYVMGHFYL